MISGSVPGTPYVFLCPAFFKLPIAPLTSQCPVPTSMSTLRGSGSFIMTQYTDMVHELVRMYLGAHLKTEYYGLNDVLGLGAGESVINPGSYTWYAAC